MVVIFRVCQRSCGPPQWRPEKRTRRGWRQRLENGYLRPCSLGPLYGYRYVDQAKPDQGKRTAAKRVRYAIEEDQPAIVRQVFAWSAGGWTIRRISKELMRRGIPGPRTADWSEPMLKKILNETAYYGEAHACRRKVVKVRVGDRMVRKGFAQPRSE